MFTDWTPKGASGDVFGLTDDEPICVQSGIFVSFAAAKNPSHSPEWIDGKPSACTFSENAIAFAPLSAHRCTSATASAVSHNGTMIIGM